MLLDDVSWMTLKISTSTDPTSTVELVVAPSLDELVQVLLSTVFYQCYKMLTCSCLYFC